MAKISFARALTPSSLLSRRLRTHRMHSKEEVGWARSARYCYGYHVDHDGRTNLLKLINSARPGIHCSIMSNHHIEAILQS